MTAATAPSVQAGPSALAHRLRLLDEIGVGPLWLRRDAVSGSGAAAAAGAASAPLESGIETGAETGAETGIATELILCAGSDAAAGAVRYLFIAPAGGAQDAEQLFDNILLALGMQKSARAQADLSGLSAQIASHRPSALVLMDPAAARRLTGDADAAFESLRGRIHRVGDVPALVTYSAAHLLRNLADKRKVWDDLSMLMALQADDVADPA
jgi:hypothetical protein